MAQTDELTENEGGLVALIQRKGPLSAYQIAKEYDASPVYTFNTAKGKLYPLLERLIERGLVESERVLHDRRRTKLYSCTDLGRKALKRWVNSFRAEHELPPDPLRRKLQAFELLTVEEQRAWVDEARARLQHRLEAVEAFDAKADGVFMKLAQENARLSLRGRLQWLDDLRSSIETNSEAG